MTAKRARQLGWRAVPRGIWALGLVSLFMDMSSELIHSLLPVFLVTTLGAGAFAVGLIEGMAEATAAITKVFSGGLSDYLGRRKLLAVAGYGLAAVTKPLFPLAGSVAWVFAARFLDRVGKGIRGAPRDALVADLAPAEIRGACFGLRQALDTAGAFAGPLAALGLMLLLAGDIRAVFWVATVPALVAVAVLLWGVREPARPVAARPGRWPLRAAALGRLGAGYGWLVAVAALLTFARFGEAFLVLRADSVGLPLPLVPLVFVVMNAAYALSAYPAGRLSDRIDRRGVLAAGYVVLLAADLVLARATGVWWLGAGVVLWGLHMGLSQGLLSAMVADAAPVELRATAFGLFNLVTGVAMLGANLLAGLLWDRYGAPATFLAGALLTVLALAALFACRRRLAAPGSRKS